MSSRLPPGDLRLLLLLRRGTSCRANLLISAALPDGLMLGFGAGSCWAGYLSALGRVVASTKLVDPPSTAERREDRAPATPQSSRCKAARIGTRLFKNVSLRFRT